MFRRTAYEKPAPMMLWGLRGRTQNTGADGAKERDRTYGHGKGVGINPELWSSMGSTTMGRVL